MARVAMPCGAGSSKSATDNHETRPQTWFEVLTAGWKAHAISEVQHSPQAEPSRGQPGDVLPFTRSASMQLEQGEWVCAFHTLSGSRVRGLPEAQGSWSCTGPAYDEQRCLSARVPMLSDSHPSGQSFRVTAQHPHNSFPTRCLLGSLPGSLSPGRMKIT